MEAVGLGLSLFGSIMGEKESTDQWNAAREAEARNAKLNADLVRMETEEELRRKEEENERLLGAAAARAAGSGFRAGSESNVVYLSDLERELIAEADWIRKSGESRENIYLDAANAATDSISSPNYLLAGVGGLSSGLQWFQ